MSKPNEFPQDMRIDLFDSTQILIPFTREEWNILRDALSSLIEDTSVWWGDEDLVTARNIIDRIEKNLGVE
jgi:hypothetical protein